MRYEREEGLELVLWLFVGAFKEFISWTTTGNREWGLLGSQRSRRKNAGGFAGGGSQAVPGCWRVSKAVSN